MTENSISDLYIKTPHPKLDDLLKRLSQRIILIAMQEDNGRYDIEATSKRIKQLIDQSYDWLKEFDRISDEYAAREWEDKQKGRPDALNLENFPTDPEARRRFIRDAIEKERFKLDNK